MSDNIKDNLAKLIPFPKQLFCDEHLFCQNKALNEFVWEEYDEKKAKKKKGKKEK